jgi:iron complex outermembrane recepter protein
VDARHKGVEAEVFVKPVDGLRLDGSVTYLDAKFTQDTQFTTQDGTLASFKGLKRPFAPDWSWNVRATYDVVLGSAGTITLAADANGRSDRIRPFLAPTGTRREFALNATGGYTLFNARIGWRAENERLSVAGFVRNIADKAYVASPVTDGNGSFSQLFGEPRTYGVEASVKF